MRGAAVDVEDTEISRCERAGVIYVNSTGTLRGLRVSEARFGLVLQGTAQPVVEANNEITNNREQDRVGDGDLPVPDGKLVLP